MLGITFQSLSRITLHLHLLLSRQLQPTTRPSAGARSLLSLHSLITFSTEPFLALGLLLHLGSFAQPQTHVHAIKVVIDLSLKMSTSIGDSETTTALLTSFRFDTFLNTDSQGRRIVLQGTIQDQPALLLAERAAFPTDDNAYFTSFAQLLNHVRDLGENDIYRWYMANTSTSTQASSPSDLKLNLIWPATAKHFKKYSFQQTRAVTETPEIYGKYVRPYMKLCREEGRLNWVFNILEGRKEQENVLYKSQEQDPKDDFLLLPDLNWDRKTIGSLHLLALVQRRDIWSVRDLTRADIPWLKHLRQTILSEVEKLYPGVESDMLKVYIHYQPTYYHFHIHVVHVNLDATGTQAVGKALGMENIISQLEWMHDGDKPGEDGEASMDQVDLTYTVGEESELWQKIYLPLKEGREVNLEG